MLEQIMREVAEEAKESNRKATERYFEAMRRNALAKQAKWAHAIELALNGKRTQDFYSDYQKDNLKRCMLRMSPNGRKSCYPNNQ